MKTKHKHDFVDGKSKKVAVCSCGAFKHINLKPEDVIMGIETKTETQHQKSEGHSPTLEILRADRSWSNESKGEGSNGCLADDSGRILYHLYTPADFAYAAFIVRAVNSYHVYEALLSFAQAYVNGINLPISAVKQVLKQAEGL